MNLVFFVFWTQTVTQAVEVFVQVKSKVSHCGSTT